MSKAEALDSRLQAGVGTRVDSKTATAGGGSRRSVISVQWSSEQRNGAPAHQTKANRVVAIVRVVPVAVDRARVGWVIVPRPAAQSTACGRGAPPVARWGQCSGKGAAAGGAIERPPPGCRESRAATLWERLQPRRAARGTRRRSSARRRIAAGGRSHKALSHPGVTDEPSWPLAGVGS